MTIFSRDIYKSYVSRGKAKNALYGALLGLAMSIVFISLDIILNLPYNYDMDYLTIMVSLLSALACGPVSFLIIYKYYVNILKNTETDSSGKPINPRQLEKYKLYTGNIKRIFSKGKKYKVVSFVNGEEAISLLVGNDVVEGMSVGEKWTIGYINTILVSLCPEIHDENDPATNLIK
jgi:Na+/proline symporter